MEHLKGPDRGRSQTHLRWPDFVDTSATDSNEWFRDSAISKTPTVAHDDDGSQTIQREVQQACTTHHRRGRRRATPDETDPLTG